MGGGDFDMVEDFFFFFCDVRIPSNKFVNFTGDAVCYCVNIVKYWVQHDGSVK